MEMTKQVIFKINGADYGIDINLVNAIEKYTDIVAIPNAPLCVEGILNLRGEVIPVYNLREKFHLPKKGVDVNTKLIVTKSNGMKMAFEVDEMNEIVEIEADDISPAPIIVKTKKTEYVDKIAKVKDRLVILLNIDGILDEDERDDIEKLMEEHE